MNAVKRKNVFLSQESNGTQIYDVDTRRDFGVGLTIQTGRSERLACRSAHYTELKCHVMPYIDVTVT